MTRRTFLIPLAGGKDIAVTGDFPVTVPEWVQFIGVLNAMNPGLAANGPASADRVDEVTLPEGLLRIELDSIDVDGPGRMTAYLNGEQITRERAMDLVEKNRRRTGEQQ